ERHQPETRHTEAGEVVEPSGKPSEVTIPVAIGIGVRLDVETVDDRVLVPLVVQPQSQVLQTRTSVATMRPGSLMSWDTTARPMPPWARPAPLAGQVRAMRRSMRRCGDSRQGVVPARPMRDSSMLNDRGGLLRSVPLGGGLRRVGCQGEGRHATNA